MFFFNDTANTEIYTLSLHAALPISLDELVVTDTIPLSAEAKRAGRIRQLSVTELADAAAPLGFGAKRSEEHTSELQSRQYLPCRLLLEKKKTTRPPRHPGAPRPNSS